MTALVTSDLHLTESARDEYRWGIFPWLRAQVKKTGANYIILCGDLTDAKDRHSAILVNRVVEELAGLAEAAEVVLLPGNHDFISEGHPFFAFTHRLGEADFHYINKPTEFGIKIGTEIVSAVFLPCTRNWKTEWESLDNLALKLGGDIKRGCAYIFTHQTYDGCLSENGTELEGIPPSFFAGFRGQVISGDIHVPQTVGKNIVYVGSPYRVHFGDTFTPRVLLLKPGKLESLYPRLMSREVISIERPEQLSKIDLPMRTQVKIKVHLKRQQFGEKPQLRSQIMQWAETRQIEVCGLEWLMIKVHDIADEAEEEEIASRSPTDIIRAYAKQKKLDKTVREAGLGFLKGL